jgi:dipeptidyl-peptidase-4
MRIVRPHASLFALAMMLAALAHAAAPPDFLDRYALTRGFRSGQPTAIAIPRGGDQVLFLRSGPRDRVQTLWTYDVASRTERELVTGAKLLGGGAETLSPEEKARRERLRLTARGLSSFQVSRDGKMILIPYSGRLFMVDRANAQARELAAARSGEAALPSADDARLSPDGTRLALVRDGEMRVTGHRHRRQRARDREARERRCHVRHARVRGAGGDGPLRGLLVVARFALPPRAAHRRERAREAAHHGSLESHESARGESLSQARHGERRRAARDLPGRGRHAGRSGLGSEGVALPLPRALGREGAARDLRDGSEATAGVDAERGPGTGRTAPLLGEHDEKWINLPDGAPIWLPDGKTFLWISEHDDTGPALELQQADATSRRLTPAGLRVRKLLGMDEMGTRAWVLASDEPTETHLWSVDLKKPWKAKRANPDAGIEDAVVSPDGGTRVRWLAPERGATRWFVEDAEGTARGELKSVAEDPGVEPQVEWTRVGTDSLRAFIIRPRDYRAGLRYPVIDWAYAGPHSQRVLHSSRRYLLEQWLADQGFIVLTVDGHGTPGRGRSFERAIRGDFIGPALADHKRALKDLCARYPEMDAARIGAFGWSFGGFYAAEAVLHAPETYRASVAGAPVVDWHDYDTFYTERYLGVPPVDSAPTREARCC